MASSIVSLNRQYKLRVARAINTVSVKTLRLQQVDYVKMTNTTDVKPNLEAILNDVNRFVNINKDRRLYANHFEKLRDQIFDKLRENDLFDYLFKGYQLGGSYGDNLKVTKPNEFDLVFHIKFPDHHLVTVEEDDCLPGNVHLNLSNVLRKIRNEKQHKKKIPHLRKWLDENDYILVKKLQAFFESCFHKALLWMDYKVYIDGELANLRYTKEGPAHTIHVTGRNNFKYSVDFVPGILMKECQSVMLTHVGDWEAIPKPLPNLNYDHTSFRSSFYRQEQKLIKNNKNLKNVLRLMKKFRDAHLNMHKMKSYFIKTLFLWKAHHEARTDFWHKSLTVIIIEMFRAFEDTLQRGNLQFFWDPRLNLYEHFSNNLFREMLGTVQSARNTLETAAWSLTLPLQNRVYAIFLVAGERHQQDEDSEDGEILDFEPQNEDVKPKEETKSYCVIL